MYRFFFLLIFVAFPAMAQVPFGIPQRTWATFQDPSLYQQHMMKDSTNQRMCYTRNISGTWEWKCWADSDAPVPVANGVRSMSSPPSSPVSGDTYFDSTKGCAQWYVGGSWLPASCPLTTAPAQPTWPWLLGQAGASAPLCSGSACPDGTAYYNTTCKQILLKTAGSWASCPAQTVGDTKWDTVDSCHKDYDGSTWSECHTTQKTTTFTVTSALLALGATVNYTVTIPGAKAGKGSCSVEFPTSSFPVVGIVPHCKITADNTLTVQFQGPIAGLGLTLGAGTYRAFAQVPR